MVIVAINCACRLPISIIWKGGGAQIFCGARFNGDEIVYCVSAASAFLVLDASFISVRSFTVLPRVVVQFKRSLYIMSGRLYDRSMGTLL